MKALIKLGKSRGVAIQRGKDMGAHSAAAILLVAATAGLAVAGTDSTFGSISQQIVDWLGGSLGLTLAGVSLIFGIGSAVIRFDWKLFAASIGVALAATLGPGILGGLVSAIV